MFVSYYSDLVINVGRDTKVSKLKGGVTFNLVFTRAPQLKKIRPFYLWKLTSIKWINNVHKSVGFRIIWIFSMPFPILAESSWSYFICNVNEIHATSLSCNLFCLSLFFQFKMLRNLYTFSKFFFCSACSFRESNSQKCGRIIM